MQHMKRFSRKCILTFVAFKGERKYTEWPFSTWTGSEGEEGTKTSMEEDRKDDVTTSVTVWISLLLKDKTTMFIEVSRSGRCSKSWLDFLNLPEQKGATGNVQIPAAGLDQTDAAVDVLIFMIHQKLR